MRTSSLLTSVILIAGAFTLGFLAWPSSARSESQPSAMSDVVGPPAPPPTTFTDTPLKYRGMAVQIQTNYKPVETFTPSLKEIADLGANSVLIAVTGYMEHGVAQGLYIEQRKTPSREDLVQLIRNAKAAKLKVLVMPMVLLAHPRGGEWRGKIEPPNWDKWWEDYRRFITYFADAANEGGADALLIGSELVKTEEFTAEWVKTIEAVRERFPNGELGYSANWDTYHKVEFWDKLDFIGMTLYHELTRGVHPDVDELLEAWKPIRDQILACRREFNKPIVMTEVGWCSQTGAAREPWNYYLNQHATSVGHEEQRRLYEAFVASWDRVEGLEGVLFWEWTLGDGGSKDYGYTVENKPAEKIVRAWFAEQNARDSRLAAQPAAPAPRNTPADAE